MRADLAALTPDAAATLSNRGLVKRAQREMDEGLGPRLDEDADGAVAGTFPSGVEAVLRPGLSLQDAACSCGAPTVCRHRVATALAYARAHAGAVAEAAFALPDDAALAAFVGATAWRRVKAALRAGLDAEVVRGAELAVRLPAATVRFVGSELALARCDCVAGPRCEHVALAVYALRDPADAGRVYLGRTDVALEPPASAALEAWDTAVEDVLSGGAAIASAAFAARLDALGRRLGDAGLTWPATLVADLDETLRDYAERGARYHPARLAALLAEARARRRAAAAGGRLPARSIFGLGEPREVKLGSLRVVALGARVEADGARREVTLLLADPAAALVLAHRRRWRAGDDEPADGPALGERTVITGVRIRELAHAEALLRDLARAADGTVRWTAFRRGLASATPLGGTGRPEPRAAELWGALPAPLLVDDLRVLDARRRRDPPDFLAPRLVTSSTRVVALGDGRRRIGYAPGRQALVVHLQDRAGNALRLVREHRSAAPRALEAIAAAVPAARYVAGPLRATGRGWEMDPCGLVSDRLIVPDLAASAGALDTVLEPPSAEDPLREALEAAESLLADAAHLGLAALPTSWHQRSRRLVPWLAGVGLAALATRVAALAAQPTPVTWEDAALDVVLAADLAPNRDG